MRDVVIHAHTFLSEFSRVAGHNSSAKSTPDIGRNAFQVCKDPFIRQAESSTNHGMLSLCRGCHLHWNLNKSDNQLALDMYLVAAPLHMLYQTHWRHSNTCSRALSMPSSFLLERVAPCPTRCSVQL